MTNQEAVKPTCGIVMPISTIDDCSEGHWTEVQSILTDAISSAGFEGNIVSTADEVGIIHKRIIQNLYDNPMVVCDVSCKNPNVMFELGLRLAFDKPTIIVKDDKTTYSFDTSAIEHLEYPRDLRFNQVVDFKRKLAEKISATHKKATDDPENYTTFLKHFGEFKVAKIDETEVTGQEFIIEELKHLKQSVDRIQLDRRPINSRFIDPYLSDSDLNLCMRHVSHSDMNSFMKKLMCNADLKNVGIKEISNDHYHLVADLEAGVSHERIKDIRRQASKLKKHRSKVLAEEGAA